MKNFSYLYSVKTAFLLILISGVLLSCDNSTGDDHEHEEEPVGMIIKLDGVAIAERTESGSVTGSLSLSTNTSTAFTVLFVSEDGDEFTPHVDEHSITVTAVGEGFTVVSTNSDSEPFGFTLRGATAGTGSVQITMNHEGSPEFGPITFTVVVS